MAIRPIGPKPECAQFSDDPYYGETIAIHKGSLSDQQYKKVIKYLKERYFYGCQSNQACQSIEFVQDDDNSPVTYDRVHVYISEQTYDDFIFTHPSIAYCAYLDMAADDQGYEDSVLSDKLWKAVHDPVFLYFLSFIIYFNYQFVDQGEAMGLSLSTYSNSDGKENRVTGETIYISDNEIKQKRHVCVEKIEVKGVLDIDIEYRESTYEEILAAVIAHETLHVLGFKHESQESPLDIMTPGFDSVGCLDNLGDSNALRTLRALY